MSSEGAHSVTRGHGFGAPGRRARHLGYLLGDVWWMARTNRMWWLIPALLVLLLALSAAGAAQSTVPYAVYTLL